MILRIADCGEVLGLHASITGMPHTMTVATMQPCTLDFVNRENLMIFLRAHGDATLRVIEQAARGGRVFHDDCLAQLPQQFLLRLVQLPGVAR